MDLLEFKSQDLFGPSGTLEQHLPNYEYRQEQVTMADHVYQALINESHAIVEAGTGVGKTLAYLIPLIYFTVGQKKRAVIATHTITLQEQLFEKDIPFLRTVLPIDFKVEVFKGRSNYLCLRRLQEVLHGQGGQLALLDNLEQLNLWVQTTETGDRNDAPSPIPQELWAAICCEKESCPEELCPHFRDCFYWGLRHKLSDAQIIVTNQAMLLADIRTEGSVLPKYHAVVVDEAHNLEDVATNSFSQEINRETLFAYYRTGVQLQAALQGLVPEYIVQDFRVTLDELAKEVGRYFSAIGPLITGFTTIIDETNRSDFAQTSLPKQLGEMGELIMECDLEESEVSGLVTQFDEFTTNLKNTLESIMAANDPQYVYWAEMQNGEPTLIAAPIDVSSTLQAALFADVPSVVLTSATLSTNQSFDYIRHRLGFQQANELILGSPFDYSKQAVLCVPYQAKHPNHNQYPQFTAYLILHTAAATQGGVLALFTSYYLMDTVAELIQPKLDEVGYSLFKQGDGPRLGLINDFQSTPHALLFGTNSFWEGVDIPGEALKAVVITRLPFAVPDRPVTAARLRAIEAGGGNSFVEYSVPQAILRLKQGFGRLIRTSSDYGGVVILDERILSASYGAQFIASLPPARFTRDIEELRAFR